MAVRPMNRNNLYDITTLGDMENGDLVIFTPVKDTGELDVVRKFIFHGRTVIGGMPIEFAIEATNVDEALSGWQAAAEAHLAQLKAQAQDAAIRSRLLMPGKPERPS